MLCFFLAFGMYSAALSGPCEDVFVEMDREEFIVAGDDVIYLPGVSFVMGVKRMGLRVVLPRDEVEFC